MKNQKGFIVPLLLAIIVVLVIGGGVYVYQNKKVEVPIPADEVSGQTKQASTQTYSDQSLYIIRDSSEAIDPLYKDWPRMNSLSHNPTKPGATVTINGLNFSLGNNKNVIKLIELQGDRDIEIYRTSPDGNILTFTIPKNAPTGTYMLSVATEMGWDVFRDFRIVSN